MQIMRTKRTLLNRIAQLGNIAMIECEMMRKRNQRGVMHRTNKAKKILWQYEINLFGVRGCDLPYGLPKEWENIPFSSDEFKGVQKPTL